MKSVVRMATKEEYLALCNLKTITITNMNITQKGAYRFECEEVPNLRFPIKCNVKTSAIYKDFMLGKKVIITVGEG